MAAYGIKIYTGLAVVNILVKKIVQENVTGRIFGCNVLAQYLETFFGSILGEQIAAFFGIRYAFFVTSGLLFINVCIVYKKVYNQNIIKVSHA